MKYVYRKIIQLEARIMTLIVETTNKQRIG